MPPGPAVVRAVGQRNSLPRRSRPFARCSKQPTSPSAKLPPASELPDPPFTAQSASPLLEPRTGSTPGRGGLRQIIQKDLRHLIQKVTLPEFEVMIKAPLTHLLQIPQV